MSYENRSVKKVYIPKQCRDEMQVILERPVTIVQAPMGYGKTVAVREFLKNKEVRMIWIDLKQCVNDRWWDYFCRSVRENFPDQQELCDEMVRCGRPGDGQTINQVIRIINSLKPDHPLVYVIDNFHLAVNQLVPRLIEMSVEKSHSNTHVVLLTQNVYSHMFRELTAGGRLGILDRQLFLFQEQDIENYFGMNDMELTPGQAGRLLNLTEGWISALCLMLTASKGNDTFIVPPGIYETIDSGWFSKLSEQEAELLYHVALPEEFTFEQAQFVIYGRDESQADETHHLLSDLTEQNAFLYYDEENESYHLHQMVRQFLRSKVNRLPVIKRERIYDSWGDWRQRPGDYDQVPAGSDMQGIK